VANKKHDLTLCRANMSPNVATSSALTVSGHCKATQNMTYYFRQVSKVMSDCYPNKGQLDTVIGTRHYINNNFDKS